MKTRVKKWGNSLGLRIPRIFAREARIEDGAEVEISVERGRLIVKPVAPSKYRLEKLLSGITPENRHGEVDFGVNEGREIW